MTVDRRVDARLAGVAGVPRSVGLAELAFVCNGGLPDRAPSPSVSGIWPSPSDQRTIVAARSFNAWNSYHDILARIHVRASDGTETVSDPIRIRQEPYLDLLHTGFATGWQRAEITVDVPPSGVVWVEADYDASSIFNENIFKARAPNDALYGTSLDAWNGFAGAVVSSSPLVPHAGNGTMVMQVTPGTGRDVVGPSTPIFVALSDLADVIDNIARFGYRQSAWLRALTSDASVTMSAVGYTDSLVLGPAFGSVLGTIPADGGWHQLTFTKTAADALAFSQAGYPYMGMQFDVAGGAVAVSDLEMDATESGHRIGFSVTVILEFG